MPLPATKQILYVLQVTPDLLLSFIFRGCSHHSRTAWRAFVTVSDSLLDSEDAHIILELRGEHL